MELRSALPQVPVFGITYAAGFRKRPLGAASTDAPDTSGRSVPVTPFVDARYVGVSGKPEPALICVPRVQSRSTVPFQLLTKAAPRKPWPVVYCVPTVKT